MGGLTGMLLGQAAPIKPAGDVGQMTDEQVAALARSLQAQNPTAPATPAPTPSPSPAPAPAESKGILDWLISKFMSPSSTAALAPQQPAQQVPLTPEELEQRRRRLAGGQ